MGVVQPRVGTTPIASGLRCPASFDGVIDGGTARFAAARGTFRAATLPGGDMQITAVIGAGPR